MSAPASGGSPPLPWRAALVTGSSSGIGLAVARRLASGGVGRLVLVARRADRLAALAEELRSSWGTDVEVLVADLADRDPGPGGLAAVERRLADEAVPVDLLVNNAGLGTGGSFVDVDVDRYEHQVDVNVVAALRLLHAAVGPMVARGSGSVMNVASLAAWQPTPGSAVYAAGKSFVLSLSEAVHEELRGTGVTVTAVCPGFTRTEFLDAAGGEALLGSAPGFVWMSAESVADAAVEATAVGRAVCVPGAGYRALALTSDLLPRSAKRRLMGFAQGKATRLARRRR